MEKAVFLDKDGTIIEDVGYLNHPKQIQFIPGSIDAIKKINRAGYKVIIISNQSGVARGLIPEKVLIKNDKILINKISELGGKIDDIYYCPHHPEHGGEKYQKDCDCRKPKPGMIINAAKKFNVDLSQAYMIGDHASDIEAGKNAGTKTIFVLTGHSEKEREKLLNQPDYIAPNLLQAVTWLLNN